ncbi:MAG: FixH family protein [Flavobacteriales bacterium]|nr:FixH family protein [Flavobacteriales bacterium]
MKLNWGHGIFAALALFIGMMAWFMVRAINNPEELVTEDYYKEELRYQERIDGKGMAAAAGEPVRCEAGTGRVDVIFPAAVKGAKVTGTIRFMKPNDSRADRVVPLVIDSAGRCAVDTRDWMLGAYHVEVDWLLDGVARVSEDHIDLR